MRVDRSQLRTVLATWLAVTGAGAAWAGQLVLGYVVDDAACSSGTRHWGLDIKVWDFDNQAAVPVPATAIKPGDSVRITCTHDQAWRDRLPDLQGLPERYVVWGEGTTDEMCLGLLSVTRP